MHKKLYQAAGLLFVMSTIDGLFGRNLIFGISLRTSKWWIIFEVRGGKKFVRKAQLISYLKKIGEVTELLVKDG